MLGVCQAGAMEIHLHAQRLEMLQDHARLHRSGSRVDQAHVDRSPVRVAAASRAGTCLPSLALSNRGPPSSCTAIRCTP